MSFKNTLLLLTVGTLLISALADDPWKCRHDEIDHPEPTLEDVEEKNFKEVREGRMLSGTSTSPLRLYGYYGFIGTGDFGTYAANRLIPPMLSYFNAALQNKYPVSGLYKISSSSICGESTPSVLRSGIATDFVYMVKAESDSSGNWVASTSSCSLASGSRRPLAGMTTINSALMRDPGSDVLLHEKNMICIIHELTHALGFSSSLFPHFIDSNGNTLSLSNVVVAGSLDGMPNQILVVEPLVTKLRDHFGCSTLKGGYMENSGSDATAGSHWERRQFAFEYMTSGLIYEMQMSQFTLALFESSGWYVPDYSMADNFFWGQGEGCNFLLGSCSSMGNNYEEFCTESRGCAVPGRGGGNCDSDIRSDGCKFIHPNEQLDCEYSGGASYARLPNLQTFGRGKNSKCFTGTLNSGKSSGSLTSFCFKFSCSGSGSSTVLNVNVGSSTVQCTRSGTKTVSGYGGSINCPDPQTFCSTVGAPICPRGCMGRGTCVNGVCQCYSGYSGTDCAL